MRLAILTLIFAGFLAVGTTAAVAQSAAANLSAIPYVTASANVHSAVTPVRWHVYGYPRRYGFYTHPNYGYVRPYYRYYTYRPGFYWNGVPSYGYYAYPYSSYFYAPNGVYYRAARPFIYVY